MVKKISGEENMLKFVDGILTNIIEGGIHRTKKKVKSAR